MTMNQKKALYAFGSPDREAMVDRFCTLAERASDPEAIPSSRSAAAIPCTFSSARNASSFW